MSSRPDLRPLAVLAGTLIGAAALVVLAHVGLRTLFWVPIASASAAAIWLLGAPLGRRLGVLDVNAAQMSATTWVCALPAALLVVPWTMRSGAADLGLLPLALAALGAALLGTALAGALCGWARGPASLPFPLGQAVAEIVETPRRGGTSRLALLVGGVLGASTSLLYSGYWPALPRPSWGGVFRLDLGNALGADDGIRLELSASAALLALGIFLGARGLLIAGAALLAGVIWTPQAIGNGWVLSRGEAQAWLAPIAWGLLGGALAGAVLRGLRFAAEREGLRRGALVLIAAVVATGLFVLALRQEPVATPVPTYRIERLLPQAVLAVERGDGGAGSEGTVHAGAIETRVLGEITPSRGGEPRRLALHDGTTAELKLYPAEVADPAVPLEIGRHYAVAPAALREPGRFLLFAAESARIYEPDELVLSALDRVATVRCGVEMRAGWNPLPPTPALPGDAGFCFLGREPIETAALRPLAQWWRCVLARSLPEGVRATLVRPNGVPLDQPARVRDDPGVVLRLWHEREGRVTELARHEVGLGAKFWQPLEVPAHAAAGTPAFRAICGPASVPPGKTEQAIGVVFRALEGHRFLPLEAGRIGADPGVELGIFREIAVPAGRADRPLDGPSLEIPPTPWSAGEPVRLALRLPTGRATAGERLPGVAALAQIPRAYEIGVRLVEVRRADGGWKDAFEVVVRRRRVEEPSSPELAIALVDAEAESRSSLRWEEAGRELRVLLHRGAGPLFPGRYPSGRPGEALLAFEVPGISCTPLTSGELDGPEPPRLRVEQRSLSSPGAPYGRVVRNSDGSWRPILDPEARTTVWQVSPIERSSGAAGAALASGSLAVGELLPLRQVPLLVRSHPEVRLVQEREVWSGTPGAFSIATPKGRRFALDEERLRDGGWQAFEGGYIAAVPARPTLLPPSVSSGALLRGALVLLLTACGAALASFLMAGVGELLPWTLLGALAVAGSQQLGFLVGAGPLVAFVAVIAAAHAADLGRDLKTGGIVGASASRQIGLRLGLGLVAPAAAVFVVGWLVADFPWLSAPQAQAFESLSGAMSEHPELHFSSPRLGASALAGAGAALVGFPGLGILAALGLLLPQGFALTLGLGALLRVLIDRRSVGGDVRAFLLPFAAGLLLGEIVCALAAAGWMEIGLYRG